MNPLEQVAGQVVGCTRCPRLVEWRQAVAAPPPLRHRSEEYWSRPIPGFGDPRASLLIVGLAPAAHGGNRTGRIFTGDRSGDWLFRALHRAGFANQAVSVHRDDGLRLTDCWISAVVKCAPPANKPLPVERNNCLPYLIREVRLLTGLKVIVALGSFAWQGVLKALSAAGAVTASPRPRFGHGVACRAGPYTLLGSYHPSQQNTFTGKLTEPAFDLIFSEAKRLLKTPGR